MLPRATLIRTHNTLHTSSHTHINRNIAARRHASFSPQHPRRDHLKGTTSKPAVRQPYVTKNDRQQNRRFTRHNHNTTRPSIATTMAVVPPQGQTFGQCARKGLFLVGQSRRDIRIPYCVIASGFSVIRAIHLHQERMSTRVPLARLRLSLMLLTTQSHPKVATWSKAAEAVADASECVQKFHCSERLFKSPKVASGAAAESHQAAEA